MLTNLHVKNLALIEEESIDFDEGLNILSGETGAGKSIIIGSINAALGVKTSPDFIRSGAEYGLAELLFHIDDNNIIEQIKELGVIDVEDGDLLISRKIMANRSQFKVNGQTFTAAQTRELSHLLIDIHGQHDNQMLMDESNHIDVVDTYGATEINPIKDKLAGEYKIYKNAENELKKLSLDKEQRQRELSFLEYEIDEIESANLTLGEDEELENAYRRLNNYQKIINELSVADNLLNSGNNNMSDMAGSASKALSSISDYDEKISSAYDMMSDIESLIHDASRIISDYIEECTFSPEEFSVIENRLDLINNLKSKYGNSIESILEQLNYKKEKAQQLYNYDEVLKKITESYEKARKTILNTCNELSKARVDAAKRLEEEFIKELRELNFLDVRFSIKINNKENFNNNGIDDISFYISTNPGEDLRPLSKIASGGELSRIMLAIKTVMAGKDSSISLIFDEIDAGISGKTAQMVANKLSSLSANHQIICITHLPQIASMADNHYIIQKSAIDNKTYSSIKKMDYDESIVELSRMLGGNRVTDSVIANAKEMKELANDFKNKQVHNKK
ncbi:MAG: DNA repair protein RecN [Eubacteriales bacterium]|nr:DNA repair protein RecN [Eubacteriales bacterium]